MTTPILAILALVLAMVFGGTAAAQSSLIDLSQPMTGKVPSVTHADGTRVDFGVPLYDNEPGSFANTQGAGAGISGNAGVSSGAGCGGVIRCAIGRPKTVGIRGYIRKDGTAVRSHVRSAPRGRR